MIRSRGYLRPVGAVLWALSVLATIRGALSRNQTFPLPVILTSVSSFTGTPLPLQAACRSNLLRLNAIGQISQYITFFSICQIRFKRTRRKRRGVRRQQYTEVSKLFSKNYHITTLLRHITRLVHKRFTSIHIHRHSTY